MFCMWRVIYIYMVEMWKHLYLIGMVGCGQAGGRRATGWPTGWVCQPTRFF